MKEFVDTVEAGKFLDLIYGTSQGYCDIVTRSESGQPDSERFFLWPQERSTVIKYINLRLDEDVYCSAALFSDEHRTKDDSQAVSRTVYADADTCKPENFRLPPTISVQTSPDHWHCWWVLDTEVSSKDASDAAHRIAKAHQSQGCDISGFIQSKILRVPGTANTKYETTTTVTATYSDDVYTLDTINDVYRDVEVKTQVQLNASVPKPVAKKRLLELEEQVDANKLTSLYIEKPKEGQSWSERLFKLELELFRLGMTAQEVFSVARESSCNKYNPEYAGEVTQTGVPIPQRNDPDAVLWKDVQKAEAEYLETSNIIVDESAAPIGKRMEAQQFLALEERKWCLDNPTFIDTYTQWVATRTDSAETYQRSLAWMMLSCVFGGKGYLPLSFGDTELNLWVLILGDTTRTRKSTAEALFLRMLHRFEIQTSTKLDIGSETTAEALLKELGGRDGLVSLFHRDEVHGWFSEMYGKNYLAGSLETFTKLYDGQVPVVLRATKDTGNRKRASTVFNFVGVGIRKRTAEVLTRNHFESGFLARMLWSVADPPPRKPGSEDIQFAQEEEVTKRFDPMLDELVSDLIMRTRKWEHRTPITMDAASQNRFNKWAEAGMQVVEKYGDGEILAPSFKRMANSIAKAAGLLAMYEQSDVIQMRHLLPALLQAELWFNDMTRMASEVSNTEFERRLDEITMFIQAGENQTRLESTVRRKHSKYKPREFEEILTALKMSGRIKQLSGQDKQKLQAL